MPLSFVLSEVLRQQMQSLERTMGAVGLEVESKRDRCAARYCTVQCSITLSTVPASPTSVTSVTSVTSFWFGWVESSRAAACL